MIGGFIKSNRVTALAGAGFIAGALAVSPAQAADLGGDCCADLEERVATLEATTARKGNRKVSLTISGWVNTGVLIWDDGVDSDAYVVSDNDTTLSSRLTFAGDAKINSDWSAGYNITIETQSSQTILGISQASDDGTNFGLLYSYMYVKSKQLGTLSIGLQSQATDNIGIVDHSGTLFSGNMVVFRGNSFTVNGAGGGVWSDFLACGGLQGVGIGIDCTGVPGNVVRYDLPTVAGFSLSASWGEDDFYDVALRYAGEFSGIKLGAAIGYSVTDGDETGLPGSAAGVRAEVLTLGASVMHVASGIFVSGSYEYQDSATLLNGDSNAWYIKAGIKQRWNSLGATSIYGEYANYEDTISSGAGALSAVNHAANGVTGSEVERFGVGIHQWIDAAAMQVYAKWDHLELDTSGTAGYNEQDLDTFTFGGVIFF